MLSLPKTLSSSSEVPRLRRAFISVLVFVGLLWSIKIFEIVAKIDFTGLGVYPGHLSGLVGLLTGPLIHGSFEHLVSNSLPVLILGTALLYGYPRSRWLVIPIIWLGSGLGVWLFAREVHHIGASGVTHGLMFFVFVVGILRRDRLAIVLAMLVFFLYGGMVWSIFPREQGISYESHFWGAAMGVVCAVLFRNRDPRPQVKRYDWENETEDLEDPLIGDEWRDDNKKDVSD